MKTGIEFLNEHIEESNIPAEHWEVEIGEMMERYARYCLTNLAEWLEEEGYPIHDRNLQEYLKYGVTSITSTKDLAKR